MSTRHPVSLQTYDRNGVPEHTPVWDRARSLDTVIAAFARGGTLLDRDSVDLHLSEIADKAACSLLRDRWKDDFPVAAYGELLCTVAALRSLLDYSPTPTAVEVFDWAREQKRKTAAALDGPVEDFVVQFINGPYRGVILTFPGAVAGLGNGPASLITMPIEWGDDKEHGRGEARYGRRAEPTSEGLWLYRLAEDVPEGARPHITVPDQKGGRA
ncbi:hypothetical protein [Streptomyces ardesiacus]|uniref:hypothetical protein n=1 Tax=Streptomyces ardesiacus TaxID=285564 RepID=UPI000D59F9B1|nr:hypothetical protein [Streptomyces ardesiacus]